MHTMIRLFRLGSLDEAEVGMILDGYQAVCQIDAGAALRKGKGFLPWLINEMDRRCIPGK